MKTKIFALFLGLMCILTSALAQSTTLTGFNGRIKFTSFANNGLYVRGTLDDFLDQTNQYVASDIDSADVVWDNQGRRYLVHDVISSNLTQAVVDLSRIGGGSHIPSGVGFVSRETSNGLALIPPVNSTGISTQLASRVGVHNAKVLEGESVDINPGVYGGKTSIPVLNLNDNGKIENIELAHIQNTISYIDTIPFDILISDLGTKTITGTHVIKKKTTGAVSGFGALLRVVANGVNVPSLIGFKKAVGSSAYNNQNGTVNLFLFMFDGVDYWYSIVNEVAGTNDVTPPTFVSASTNVAGTVIRIKFSENLNPDSTATNVSFSLSGGKTVTARSINLDTLFLTVSSAYVSTDVITVGYTRSTARLQDPSGNLVANFTGQTVTNGVPSTIVDVNFTSLGSNVIQASDAGGNILTSTNGGLGANAAAVSSLAIASSQNFEIYGKFINSSNNLAIIGIDALNSLQNYLTLDFLIYPNGVKYTAFNEGQTSIQNSADGVVTANSYYKLTREGGNTIKAYWSADGTSWTLFHTFPGTYSGACYIHSNVGSTKVHYVKYLAN